MHGNESFAGRGSVRTELQICRQRAHLVAARVSDPHVADARLEVVQAVRYLLDDDLKLPPLPGRRPKVHDVHHLAGAQAAQQPPLLARARSILAVSSVRVFTFRHGAPAASD